MRVPFLPSTFFLGFFAVLLFSACKPEASAPAAGKNGSATPAAALPGKLTEKDLKVGRNVMAISDVVAELRAGVPRETVLEHVRSRRIATNIVEANELELAANGAGRELMSALKDPKNLPTAAEEAAYMEAVVDEQRSAQAKRSR